MTGFSDRDLAEGFAGLLPEPPPGSDFAWVEFLHNEVVGAGYDLSDIRLIHSVEPPAFQLLGNAVEKWIVHYDGSWQVREWNGPSDEFAEGDWNEDLGPSDEPGADD